MRDLIKVYAFVDEYKQAAVTHRARKRSPKLEKVIPVIVSDYYGNVKAELFTCFGFR